MNRRIYLLALGVLILTLVLSACSGKDNQDPNGDNSLEEQLKEKDEKIAALEDEKKELEDKIKDLEGKQESEAREDNLLKMSIDLVGLIKDKDMKTLSKYVHPSKGLRFSPYDHVDVKVHRVFTKDEVAKLNEDTKVYTWGNYDGTGDPIELSFSDYYGKFVYDVNFADPQMIGNNTIIGQGNAISNIEEVYPGGSFVEFHFKSIDPKYEGMDWRSLKLVFEKQDGQWYLVGIIHGQWTI